MESTRRNNLAGTLAALLLLAASFWSIAGSAELFIDHTSHPGAIRLVGDGGPAPGIPEFVRRRVDLTCADAVGAVTNASSGVNGCDAGHPPSPTTEDHVRPVGPL